MNERICVMMSTYNGEKYIEQQIKSILNQTNVNVDLIIRDDGSSDRTVDIINKFTQTHENITLINQKKNLGCERSFFELLYSCPDADYYAFADQDDFWYESKLEKCLSEIKGENRPALVCTNLMVCDEELKEIKIMHSKSELEKNLTSSYYDYLGNMHGCVMFWNKALQDIIITYRPKDCYAHDVWVCAIANSVGIRKIISEPLIKYRLHNNNVSGYALTMADKLKKRLKLYLGSNHPKRNEMANELILGFGNYMNKSLVGYKNLKKLAGYKKGIISKLDFLFSSFFKGIPFDRRLFWSFCVLVNKF